MKTSVKVLAFVAVLQPASALYRGFNLKSYLEDGITCKSPSDWAADFKTLNEYPNDINSVRLYDSHDCSTLANAVPAAISAGLKVLVGINSEDKFSAEKGALKAAVQKHGFSWIAAVSVGSEDLYRNTITPSELVTQIHDVRGMLKALKGYPSSLKIGHVDTTNAWVDSDNYKVIRVCDFIGTDIYPYFQSGQNNSISNAYYNFWHGYGQVTGAVSDAGGDAAVWVTETGWPINGAVKGDAVPGTGNAKTYWDAVACDAFTRISVMWFTLQDWEAVPSFAVIGAQGKKLYDLDC